MAAIAKTIEMEGVVAIPILYEDRSLLALDKPPGWMLAPDSWDRTGRNLQLALQSSLNAGDFWARSRNLKFLRFIHRLDAETSGITLFAKSPGALRAYSELFEERRMEKFYLAVVHGVPPESRWTCQKALAPAPGKPGRMMIAGKNSALFKDAETHFRVLKSSRTKSLVEAHPVTGRTHQIRVHLADAGHPVVGDSVYGTDKLTTTRGRSRLALRAVRLVFRDPFERRPVRIEAPVAEFLQEFGFGGMDAAAPVEAVATEPKPAAMVVEKVAPLSGSRPARPSRGEKEKK